MRITVIISFLVLATCLGAGHSQATGGPQSASTERYGTLAGSHADIVLHAEVPLYPPLAIQGRLSGVVRLHILVENGAVTKAESESSAQLQVLVSAATENVRTWRFAPGARGTFDVTYTYELDKIEGVRSENPHIVMDLPTSVKITARPAEHTCLDCGPGSFESKPNKP
jgi:TonB family protein